MDNDDWQHGAGPRKAARIVLEEGKNVVYEGEGPRGWFEVELGPELPHVFHLVMVSATMETRIYDSSSRAWDDIPSQLKISSTPSHSTCLCTLDDHLLISQSKETILVFRYSDNQWTSLLPPPTEVESLYALGEWQGRVFPIRQNKAEEYIAVWELVEFDFDERSVAWEEHAPTSSDLTGI